MRLSTFGGITLPIGQAKVNLTSKMRSNLVTLQDGAYDLDGRETHQLPFTISYSAQINASLQSTVDALKKVAASGSHKLVAVMRDASTRYANAKVTAATFPANFQDYDTVQKFSMTFEVSYPFWRATVDLGNDWDDGWLWDDGTLWDGIAEKQVVTTITTAFNIDTGDATARMRAGTISMKCRAGATLSLPMLTNTTNGYTFRVGSTLLAGSEIVIDLLPKTIKYDGVDSYQSLYYPDNQQGFMRLEPGINAMELIVAAIVGTVDFTYQFERHYL